MAFTHKDRSFLERFQGKCSIMGKEGVTGMIKENAIGIERSDGFSASSNYQGKIVSTR